MTVRFECHTYIAAPPTVAFDLSLSVDAHLASMARSRERVVGRIRDGSLGDGDEVTWRAWHFGIPFRLTSRVHDFDRRHRFVDTQVRGPFRRYSHEHVFTPDGDDTLMIDRVEYLQGLIEERNQHLKRVAEEQHRTA